MQHLAVSLFIQGSNFGLACSDAYFDHVKASKLGYWNAVSNAPIQSHRLFPDAAEAKAQEDIFK